MRGKVKTLAVAMAAAAVVAAVWSACGEDEKKKQVDNGRLETVDGIDVLWLWGTGEQMAYAEGALLCGRIRDMFRDYVLDYAVPRAGYDYDLLQVMVMSVYTIPERYQREMVALMQGMQENCSAEDLIVESENLEPSAGGRRELNYDDMVLAHAIADWACSSLTVWGEASATGGTLHARNLDFPVDPSGAILFQHMIKVYKSSEDGDVMWASVSFPGLIGCISCFTEEGSGITMHNVDGLESSDDAVPRMLAARGAIVESVGAADRVQSAEDVLESCPQQVGNNLHMSVHCPDSNCVGGVVFEYDGMAAHADGFVTVRAPGDVGDGVNTDDAMVCTNHYVKRSAPETSGNSYERYQALVTGVNNAVAAGGLDVAGAHALMVETADLGGTPTVHTVIFDSASMELRLYVPDALDVDAPYAVPHVLDLNGLFASFPE